MLFYHNNKKIKFKNAKFNLNTTDPLDRYLDGYTLLFEDDFETFDENIWNCEIREFPPNNELQAYIPENVSVENSNLVLTAKKEKYGQRNYTSGKVDTNNKLEVLFGRIDAKVKLPNVEYLWPAFWTLGSSFEVKYEKEIGCPWPHCGEIDILEKFGKQNISNATHFNNDIHATSSQASTNYIHTQVLDYDKYHIISLEWDESTMKFLVDNTLMRTYNWKASNALPFGNPHFLMFNLAVGGRVATPPADFVEEKMYIDWIRIYELPSRQNAGEITGVSIINKPTSINLDEHYYLMNTTVTPENSYFQTLNWEVDDPSIAEVIGGRVIPIKKGTVNVTVKSKNNNAIKDTCTFSITDNNFTNSTVSEDGYILYVINERNVYGFLGTDLCYKCDIPIPDENWFDRTVAPACVNYKAVDAKEYNLNRMGKYIRWNNNTLQLSLTKYEVNDFKASKDTIISYIKNNDIVVKIKLLEDGKYKKLTLTSDMVTEIKQISDDYINFSLTVPVVLTNQRVFGDYFSTPQSTNDLMKKNTIYGYIPSSGDTSIVRVTAKRSEIPNATLDEVKTWIDNKVIYYK